MGTRAIPATRLLAAHAEAHKAFFTSDGFIIQGQQALVEPIIVFSPSMFLPAVIAKAESMAKFLFGSSEMFGTRRSTNDLGLLGIEADVMAIDGSAQGVLRGLLLARASEQVFGLLLSPVKSQLVDLSQITAYYRNDGAPALRGEKDDVISADLLLNQNWNQP